MAAAAALQSSLHGDGVKHQPVFEQDHPIRTLQRPMYGASRVPGKEEGSTTKAEAAVPEPEPDPSVILEEAPQFQLEGSIPANWAPEVAEMAGRLTAFDPRHQAAHYCNRVCKSYASP